MNLAQQIQLVQQKADTINAAQAAIGDTTKSLTADTLTALVLYARGREIDGSLVSNGVLGQEEYALRGLASAESGHFQQIQALTKQLADQVSTMTVLNNQLATLRAYLQVGTAEQLAAAVAAGQTKPLSQAELEAAKAKAIERAKSHQTSTAKA